MKTDVIQKAVILNNKGEILMVRRSKADVRRPLQWDLPGGYLEEGEEFIASIRREIAEETALEVTDVELAYAKTEIRKWKDHEGPHVRNVIFLSYLAKAGAGDVTLSSEHDMFQWKPLAEAIEQYEYPTHRELLKHILDNQLL